MAAAAPARNFDEVLETNLVFTLRGEEFTLRDVRPEVIASWEDEDAPTTAAEGLAAIDVKIKTLLAPEDVERYDALRAREDEPVNLRQLKALVEWIVEVQSDRPTEAPSPSDGGAGRRGATSSGRSR
jgi:hypothetical protein